MRELNNSGDVEIIPDSDDEDSLSQPNEIIVRDHDDNDVPHLPSLAEDSQNMYRVRLPHCDRTEVPSGPPRDRIPLRSKVDARAGGAAHDRRHRPAPARP